MARTPNTPLSFTTHSLFGDSITLRNFLSGNLKNLPRSQQEAIKVQLRHLVERHHGKIIINNWNVFYQNLQALPTTRTAAMKYWFVRTIEMDYGIELRNIVAGEEVKLRSVKLEIKALARIDLKEFISNMKKERAKETLRKPGLGSRINLRIINPGPRHDAQDLRSEPESLTEQEKVSDIRTGAVKSIKKT